MDITARGMLKSVVHRAAIGVSLLAIANLALLSVRPQRGQSGGHARLRVGLVFDIGGRGDKSFNDLAYAAIDRAVRELGVEAQYIEPGEGGDREAGIRLLAAEGFDLVVAAGYLFSDDMYAVAEEYPKVHFACIDYAKFGPQGFVPPPP